MKIYQVGGSIRDSVLGIPSKDRDFVMEASLQEMEKYLSSFNYKILHSKPEFLTMRVQISSKEVVDFTSCRDEGNYDGRSPKKVTEATLETDLSRRDFTINALAQEVYPDTLLPNGEIIDLFDGLECLKTRTLKFIGNPQDRLKEDGLRWLRAIRFCVTKNLQMHNETYSALQEAPREVLHAVSEDRIKDELNRCFVFSVEETLKWLNYFPTYWLKDRIWLKATLEDK